MTDQTVSVTIETDRATSKATVTIRLEDWSARELQHLAGSLLQRGAPDMHKLGRALAARLESANERRRP